MGLGSACPIDPGIIHQQKSSSNKFSNHFGTVPPVLLAFKRAIASSSISEDMGG